MGTWTLFCFAGVPKLTHAFQKRSSRQDTSALDFSFSACKFSELLGLYQGLCPSEAGCLGFITQMNCSLVSGGWALAWVVCKSLPSVNLESRSSFRAFSSSS